MIHSALSCLLPFEWMPFRKLKKFPTALKSEVVGRDQLLHRRLVKNRQTRSRSRYRESGTQTFFVRRLWRWCLGVLVTIKC